MRQGTHIRSLGIQSYRTSEGTWTLLAPTPVPPNLRRYDWIPRSLLSICFDDGFDTASRFQTVLQGRRVARCRHDGERRQDRSKVEEYNPGPWHPCHSDSVERHLKLHRMIQKSSKSGAHFSIVVTPKRPALPALHGTGISTYLGRFSGVNVGQIFQSNRLLLSGSGNHARIVLLCRPESLPGWLDPVAPTRPGASIRLHPPPGARFSTPR